MVKLDKARLLQIAEEKKRKSREEAAALAGNPPAPDTTAAPPLQLPAIPAQPITTVPSETAIPSEDSQALKRRRVREGKQTTQTPSPLNSLDTLEFTNATQAAVGAFAIGRVARSLADYLSSVAKVAEENDRLKKDLGEAKKRLSSERGEKEKLKGELSKLKGDLSKVSSEKETLQADLGGVKKELADKELGWSSERSKMVAAAEESSKTVAELRAEVKGLENEAAEQYINGYQEAIKHARSFLPEFDFSAFDPFKEVVDGKWVEPRPDAS